MCMGDGKDLRGGRGAKYRGKKLPFTVINLSSAIMDYNHEFAIRNREIITIGNCQIAFTMLNLESINHHSEPNAIYNHEEMTLNWTMNHDSNLDYHAPWLLQTTGVNYAKVQVETENGEVMFSMQGFEALVEQGSSAGRSKDR